MEDKKYIKPSQYCPNCWDIYSQDGVDKVLADIDFLMQLKKEINEILQNESLKVMAGSLNNE